MALLPDINVGGVLTSGDVEAKLNSLTKQVNEWGRIISNESRTSVLNDDSGTPRMLTGFHKDGFEDSDVGIKLSQTGKDVTVATGADLIFSTDFNLFKIIATFTVTVAALTVATGGSNSTESSIIDLSSYPTDSIILPIATIATGGPREPNIFWQGSVIGGVNDWWITYNYTYDSQGNPSFSRLIGNLSGSNKSDYGYNIKVYVLQETQS